MNNRTIRVLGIIVAIIGAVYAITWISAARRTGRYLEDLALQEPDKVMDAIGALRDRGKSVAPRLAELVRAGKPDASARAAWLLGMVGSHAGDADLTQALQSQDQVLRLAAMQALGQLRVTTAGPAISALLASKTEKTEIRVAAAYALGAIGDPQAVTGLAAALGQRPPKAPEPPAAPAAAPAAAAVKPAAPAAPAPPPDTTIPVRIAVARALGTIRSEQAVNALAAAITDLEPDAEVRLAASYALADVAAAAEDESAESAAISGLLEGLKDKNADVNMACAYGLSKCSLPESMRAMVSTAIGKAKTDPGYWTRLAAARSSLLLKLPE